MKKKVEKNRWLKERGIFKSYHLDTRETSGTNTRYSLNKEKKGQSRNKNRKKGSV